MEREIEGSLQQSIIELSAQNDNKIVTFPLTDNFALNNFIAANPGCVTTSAVANNQLTITGAAGSQLISSQINKKMGNGHNAMLNTKFLYGTATPQVHMRISGNDVNDYYKIYYSSGKLYLNRVVAGVSTGILNANVTPAESIDIEFSMRTFGNMIEGMMRQSGEIIAKVRAIESTENNAVFANRDLNGLGANASTVYKEYYKAVPLKGYVNIVCIGASNMAGTAGPAPLTFSQYYPTVLQNLFFDENVSVVNLGVSGDPIEDTVALLSTIEAQFIPGARNIIVSLFGNNDLDQEESAATIFSQYQGLAGTLKAFGFEIFNCTLPPANDAGNAIRIALNALYRADTIADAVIDLYPQFAMADGTIITRMFQADGLHWSDIGAIVTANKVAEAIRTA